ncbi:uncharacterized protein F4812DRAFT_237451 [Daldinia caldariorum]|uniref:uncharacterized protein n=1 Tax=Daldinia caldariorum TaxID=326644 RepID=UPI0020079ECF|nr:uncharacterized protein F4812DRAFT_237451 [Daldinia caldariorum]KAI1463669.1 hypothetical protein F4812DRAFT_237451 [Daldinia caldariorum]
MPDGTFFEGSLQDGINLAIQQSKMVLAFVTDSGDESQLWEDELRTNDSLKAPLEHQAVALRLQAGSEEAGFLEALFPIPKKPTVVIIQNGTLKEYIQGGTAREDLIRRVAAILSTTSTTQAQQPAATPASQPSPAPPAPTSTRNHVTDDLYDNYDIPARSSPAPAESSREGQDLLAARRLEAEKKAKEAKEAEAKEAKAKAEREAKAQERRRASENNEGQSSSSSRPERSYAEEVRQQKIRAAEDRKRILKRIEDDKRERREREAKEKQARLLLSSTNDAEASSSQTPPIALPRRQASSSSGGEYCNLQVRLLDGSTIRSRFKSDASLGSEVRKWIDEDRTDGDAPYTFRIVLTPLPNKAVEPPEESQSLLSLGLAPSATLVLVPAKYSSAFPFAFARASDNFVWRSLSYILGFVGSGYGLLSGLLGELAGLLTGRGAAAPEEVPLQNLAAGRAAGSSRIRGFDSSAEERRRDAQLYNGNSVSFFWLVKRSWVRQT